ncbi:MAG: hypothetical protein LBH80_02820 [Prevotellaceae bacterium]|jgi:hypothetical protein|nr:hypothetical protein [Prevotellaceae bacterium]
MKEFVELKLDLTKTTTAVVVRRRGDGREIQQEEKTPLSGFVTQSLKRVRSFAEAEANRNLLKNASSGKPFSVTPEEFKIVFDVFKNAETETMLAFSDMVREQNNGFSVVEYEDSL